MERLVQPDRLHQDVARLEGVHEEVREEDRRKRPEVRVRARELGRHHERGRVGHAMVEEHFPGAGAVDRRIVVLWTLLHGHPGALEAEVAHEVHGTPQEECKEKRMHVHETPLPFVGSDSRLSRLLFPPRAGVEFLDNILTGRLGREIVPYMRMHYSADLVQGLEAYGLDKKEAKVYLAALELGPTSVLELSRRTSLPRTTLYPILERLKMQGVFRVGKKKSTTVFTAEAPARLSERMHERENELQKSVPALELLQETAHGGPGVTFYEGTDGFKRLWKQILDSGVKEYRLLTSGVGLRDYVKETYLVERVIAERKKRGMKSLQLIRDSRVARQIISKDSEELRESRLLPSDIDLPATVIIFADQVAFVTTRRENMMIILASGDVAVTYRTLFDLVWNKAQRVSSNL